jgi:hypothetical protein
MVGQKDWSLLLSVPVTVTKAGRPLGQKLPRLADRIRAAATPAASAVVTMAGAATRPSRLTETAAPRRRESAAVEHERVEQLWVVVVAAALS